VPGIHVYLNSKWKDFGGRYICARYADLISTGSLPEEGLRSSLG
jgi:hypothetical protein